MTRILIIEDEKAIRMALEDDFLAEGYEVDSANTGTAGLKKGLEPIYDIILLDIMLPEMDGFEVLKELRKRNVRTPIIMLTAKSQEIDKILGLEFGADDYITKPFSPRELQARVKAVLRRVNEKPEISSESQFLFGDITVDFQKYECLKAGEIIQLTTLEFDLLKFLINHKGVVVSRDRIMDEVWGKEVFVAPRTVDTHILNLRKKIEDNPAQAKWIISVRGRGYKFLSS
ncbi:MAG: response regulator transcription factor [Prolixibacteraceae bacterium]|jgi:two-component system, OmpR family, alkaline phosphatase synthesis response regulator PhoP|nr:response regulator transcription factor [Prolixibacteraceae bacterium]MBT6767075.1 response regulator transcription factor [Prolixibacteraceae bacterium]MBT6997434.1 response regulator transcription factor [Prolixibacteraceae bacterium]MBT7396645.1 response regulator transcription factor [Prolixibacteraceae bacterium]